MRAPTPAYIALFASLTAYSSGCGDDAAPADDAAAGEDARPENDAFIDDAGNDGALTAADADVADDGDVADAAISCRADRGCPRGSRCATAGVHEVAFEGGESGACTLDERIVGSAPATWRWVTGGRPLADRLCLAGGLSRGAGEGADALRARQIELVAATGVRLLRLDIPWIVVEPERGVRDFSAVDPMVDAARDAGIEVLGILAYGTPWASSDPAADAFYPPDDPADFAAYARATAEHFEGRIDRFEIWNEPNAGYRFWRPTLHGDARAFGALLAAATVAVREGCPRCGVMGGGFFFHEMLINGALEFVHDMLDAHPEVLGPAPAGLDALSFHPYPRYPPQSAPEDDEGDERAMGGMLDDLRAVLSLHGTAEPPFAMTEVGWPTYGEVSETTQAAHLARSLLLGAALGMDPLCWFNLADGPNHGGFPPEDDFGVYRFDSESAGTTIDPKPARDALAWLARLGDGATLMGTVDDAALHSPAEGRFALDFDAPSGRWTVLWRTDGIREEVRLERETRIAHDMTGAELARPTGGTLVVEVSGEPIYLVPP